MRDDDDEPFEDEYWQTEERCVICGRPATDYYPPDETEAEPSCGSPRCEFLMQQAQDFHDECGSR